MLRGRVAPAAPMSTVLSGENSSGTVLVTDDEEMDNTPLIVTAPPLVENGTPPSQPRKRELAIGFHLSQQFLQQPRFAITADRFNLMRRDLLHHARLLLLQAPQRRIDQRGFRFLLVETLG
jgi:hypothetical protein